MKIVQCGYPRDFEWLAVHFHLFFNFSKFQNTSWTASLLQTPLQFTTTALDPLVINLLKWRLLIHFQTFNIKSMQNCKYFNYVDPVF